MKHFLHLNDDVMWHFKPFCKINLFPLLWKNVFKFEHYFDLLHFWKCLQMSWWNMYIKRRVFFIFTSISQQSYIQKSLNKACLFNCLFRWWKVHLLNHKMTYFLCAYTRSHKKRNRLLVKYIRYLSKYRKPHRTTI